MKVDYWEITIGTHADAIFPDYRTFFCPLPFEQMLEVVKKEMKKKDFEIRITKKNAEVMK